MFATWQIAVALGLLRAVDYARRKEYNIDMKTVIRNFIITLLVVLTAMLSLGGCVKNNGKDNDQDSGFTIDPSVAEHHAVTYDRAIGWLNDAFREGNLTQMPKFQDEPFTAPIDITLVIKERSDYDRAFAEFPVEVDFENKLLILYFLTDINNGRPVYVTNVRPNGNSLDVTLTHLMAPLGPNGRPPLDASQPTHRCITVLMDRVDATVVNVKRDWKRI